MRKNIWTSPSQYGTYPVDAKPVSESTARRWYKDDNRSKTRRSQTMRKNSMELENA